MLDEPIRLEAYRADWLATFETERERIAEALRVPPNSVEHIGSTAVVGLTAKPIVDIMIGSPGVPCPERWTAALANLGYEAMGEAGVPGRWYFRYRVPPFRNAHVVELHGLHWSNNLALREYLRKSPDACRRYLEAKRQAVTMGATTLVAYSRAKRLMGETLLAEALSDTRNTENDS